MMRSGTASNKTLGAVHSTLSDLRTLSPSNVRPDVLTRVQLFFAPVGVLFQRGSLAHGRKRTTGGVPFPYGSVRFSFPRPWLPA
jgi:hypothetical protein